MQSSSTKGISPTIRTIITIILLLLGLMWPIVGLVGIIVMWFWTKWPKWVKILVTIPFVGLFFLLLFLSAVGVLAYLFFIRPFQINGMAMAPNYNNGMHLMTKIVRPNNIAVEVERDDVIVFKLPKNPELEYIKRVIGLPGETVMLKSGEVYINGKKLDESKYLSPGVQTYAGAFLAEGQAQTIPAGQYFTLGDNRPRSSDSREWGFVPQENVISKVAFCYWNCSNK